MEMNKKQIKIRLERHQLSSLSVEHDHQLGSIEVKKGTWPEQDYTFFCLYDGEGKHLDKVIWREFRFALSAPLREADEKLEPQPRQRQIVKLESITGLSPLTYKGDHWEADVQVEYAYARSRRGLRNVELSSAWEEGQYWQGLQQRRGVTHPSLREELEEVVF